MGVACPKCGNEDLRVDPISRFRLGIPHLSDLKQAVVVLSCRPCSSSYQFRIQRPNGPSFSHFMDVRDIGITVSQQRKLSVGDTYRCGPTVAGRRPSTLTSRTATSRLFCGPCRRPGSRPARASTNMETLI